MPNPETTDLLELLRAARRDAHRDDLRPKGWRLSEDIHRALLLILRPTDSTLRLDEKGEATLFGLPYVIDRGLTEPFVLETERARASKDTSHGR